MWCHCVCNTDGSGQLSTRQRTLYPNDHPNDMPNDKKCRADSRSGVGRPGIQSGTEPLMGATTFERVFNDLATHRSAALGDLDPEANAGLSALGIRVRDGQAWLDDDVELLSEVAVRAALGPATADWLRTLELRSHIDSTNTTLLALATHEPIDGRVLAAEVQTAGRGRRGRQWLSPFGRNLAVSIGVAVERPIAELGALSLVVGVALRRALVEQGLSGVELKWPNDVLLDGRKVAGILIELVRAVAPVEVVVGIGVNVGCAATVAARVDQSIADVAEQVQRPSRNELLARVVDHVAAACRRFGDAGFDPFRDEWDRAHRYRNAAVRVTVADPRAGGGDAEPVETFAGTALDVGVDGALRIDTGRGIREFTGGEVTLRAVAPSDSGTAARVCDGRGRPSMTAAGQ